jgi:four helix bundle protein
MVVQSVRDLRVWQSGMELVVEVYELARTFPKSEVYGLASQLQRAAVSVPANIDEGHTCGSLREYLHFVSIAPSSPAEVETYLELDQSLSYTTPELARALLDLTISNQRQSIALRNSLSSRLGEDPLTYESTTS